MTTIRAAAVRLRSVLARSDGAVAVEYALLAAAIGATIAASIYALGAGIETNFYDRISNSLK